MTETTPAPAPDDPSLSEVDRLVIDLLEQPLPERLARLQQLRADASPAAMRTLRRLSVLGEFGLLEATEGGPKLPQQIGVYRVLRQLGRGGMGTVYLAEQPALRRLVALKVLHGFWLGSDRARERFRREALAAARLDHPGLCTVYDVGEADGVPFLAMRYVAGRTLRELLDEDAAVARRQPAPGADGRRAALLDAAAAVRLIELLALAIDHAHQHGLVHRDLKPDNVLVEPDGNPVILDFGLARHESDDHLTIAGDQIGTPAYMAPEQVGATGLPVDARTDVHALGVLLYECLTLQLPTARPDRESIYHSILRGDVAAAARADHRLHRDLRVLVATATDPNPQRRYATALLLADDLRRHRKHEPILAVPAGPGLRLRRWVRRNPVPAASLLLLSFCLGVVSWMTWQRGQALRHARSLELAHASRVIQSRDTALAHLLALAAIDTEQNVDTISQLHTTTVELRECAAFRHEASLNCGAISPDGQRIVTGGDDRVAELWDVDGRSVRRMPHGGYVRFAAFVADGSFVTADSIGAVFHWEPDGSLRRQLYTESRQRSFRDGVLHRGSNRLLLVGDDGLALWWDDLAGPWRQLPGVHGRLNACAGAADGSSFLFATNYRPLVLPDLEQGAWLWHPDRAQIVPLPGHTESITGVAIAVDYAVTASQDGWLRAFELDGRPRWEVQHSARLQGAAITPQGTTIVVTDAQGELWGWNRDGIGVGRLFQHGVQTQRLAWSRTGRLLLTGGSDGMCRLLDREGHELVRLPGHREFVTAIAWTDDERMVLTCSQDHWTRLWRVAPELPLLRGHGAAVRCLALARDGRRLLSGSADGFVCLWNLGAPDDEPIRIDSQQHLAAAMVLDVAWHPRDPEEILVCTWNQVAQRIEVLHSGEARRGLLANGPGFRSFRGAYSSDGQWLVLGGRFSGGANEGKLRCVDLLHGSEASIATGSTEEVTAVAFAPTGHWIAAGNFEGWLHFVDPDDGGKGRHVSVRAHDDSILDIAFAPDGRHMLTGSHDMKAVLWSLAGMQPRKIADLHGHEAAVTAVAWSPDGAWIATGSRDETARLWTAEGDLIAILRGNQGMVHDVVFHEDRGRLRLLTAGEDGTIRTWFVESGELLANARRLAFRELSEAESQRHGLPRMAAAAADGR